MGRLSESLAAWVLPETAATAGLIRHQNPGCSFQGTPVIVGTIAETLQGGPAQALNCMQIPDWVLTYLVGCLEAKQLSRLVGSHRSHSVACLGVA